MVVSASFVCGSVFFWYNWLVTWIRKTNELAPRLIHNRPGPVGCENAWDRYATSQQHAGPEKGPVTAGWVSPESRPLDSSAYRLSFWFWR
jgi:hypothetical protein